MELVPLADFAEAIAAADVIRIWTDGACHPNPNGFGGWAVVFQAGEAWFELVGSEAGTTNNRMELLAAVHALEAIGSRRKKVELTSDSSYVIRGMTEWMPGWTATGRIRFEEVDGGIAPVGPLPNVDLWGALVEAASHHEIKWIHVRGHGRGAVLSPENERCDKLAVEARKNLERKTNG